MCSRFSTWRDISYRWRVFLASHHNSALIPSLQALSETQPFCPVVRASQVDFPSLAVLYGHSASFAARSVIVRGLGTVPTKFGVCRFRDSLASAIQSYHH